MGLTRAFNRDVFVSAERDHGASFDKYTFDGHYLRRIMLTTHQWEDLVIRIDEVTTTKKRKQVKEIARNEALESKGDKLCRDAETSVMKRTHDSVGSVSEDDGESPLSELREFEKDSTRTSMNTA
ncbi:hypothetical protein H257_10199 [Aphanomyces astaci]|uniref:Uncharacterized protein n=1 Tax=Aphanomyces astaci TaxID=112090 RepID=W4G6K1_APHAT|nr:hypothetical protein H257_10199 [Aphanomyces astaci]ETV75337.1 hypothetical protein H257_10199 [Aphanomyces astaci]|eukprot:XP_009834971.1 hypothetical protein H257_10199 [Aphanomyces astaci]